ncbi:MAG TPA: hypothetical protein VGD18_00635, partial [Thiobacillaceae bacterium]
KMKPANPGDVAELLDAAAYQKLVESEAHGGEGQDSGVRGQGMCGCAAPTWNRALNPPES